MIGKHNREGKVGTTGARNAEDHHLWPGWVFVKAHLAGNNIPSYLTLFLRSLSEKNPAAVAGTMPRPQTEAHNRMLRSVLVPPTLSRQLDADPSRLTELRSEPRRHMDRPNLIEKFAILDRANWKPPRQGAVIAFPTWHPRRADETWLVVSNTRFNTTFYYPEVIIVPLTSLSRHAATVEEAREERLLVVGPMGDLGYMIAWPSLVRTFSFSSHHLGACARCPDHKRYPSRWLIEGGPDKGRCLRCDPGKSSGSTWPATIAVLGALELEPIVAAIMRLLNLEVTP